MPDLLLELFSEEIPARMQAAAAADLERLVVGALSDQGLLFEGVRAFSGPRRLTLAIQGLPAQQRDLEEERKGPRVGAPEKAIEGFLRSAGVTLEQCVKESDGKGEFYVARISRRGRATAEVLSEILPEILAKLPWPKSMRWPGSTTRWVRPLHAILCTLDGAVVPFEFAGVASGNATYGHRFLSSGAIEVRRFDDYVKKLRDAHVILDAAERREIILHELKQKTFALGLEWIEDDGLLHEVSGLAEWPVVLIGKIDDAFMDLPPEIMRTAMRTHQKYFALRKPGGEGLTNRFAFVANMVAADGGKEIVSGNERVLRPRLSDAKFFWEQDKKRTLESRVDDLKKIVFHAKLGTQYERVLRIEALAGEIAAKIGADVEKSKRAARLCKADLMTGVVGEFPELQGAMGRYFALHDGEDVAVAEAIRDHYKPLGPNDRVPSDSIGIAVALADKIDSLVSLWCAGEKPTGSKDPFALRRSALGIIRIVLENQLRLPLTTLLNRAISDLRVKLQGLLPANATLQILRGAVEIEEAEEIESPEFLVDFAEVEQGASITTSIESDVLTKNEVLEFLTDRLKVVLRDKGFRYDMVDASLSVHELRPHDAHDDFVLLVGRVEALRNFLGTDDGGNLLSAYKRTVNILKPVEKQRGQYNIEPNSELFSCQEEKMLFEELSRASVLITGELQQEGFVESMTLLASLRPAVDAFFNNVRVNDEDHQDRSVNRLRLLSRLRAVMHQVANFSKIEG